jgi:hypothetical protein
MNKRWKTPRRISVGINNFLRKVPLKAKVLHKLSQNWKDIAGPNIARHSSPYDIQNRRLIINVDETVWINELTLCKDDIKDKIHKFLRLNAERNLIESLRFREGEVSRYEVEKKKNITFKLSPDTLKLIEEKIASVDDKKLKEALKKYFITISLTSDKDTKNEGE